MIRHYVIGNPIETDSVVMNIPVEGGEIPGFSSDPDAKAIRCRMDREDVIYGLGETVRGMNKRNWLYISNNTDDYMHTEGKHSLYASQNFILVFSPQRAFGLYVDTPGKVIFDLGYTDPDVLVIDFDDFDADEEYYRSEEDMAVDMDEEIPTDPDEESKDENRDKINETIDKNLNILLNREHLLP